VKFDYLLDILTFLNQPIVIAFVAFVLYNINNKRSEDRKQGVLDQDKNLDTKLKLDEANDMIGKQEILAAIKQLSVDLSLVDGTIDRLGIDLDGKIDRLGVDLNGKIDRLDARVEKIDEKIDRLDSRVSSLTSINSNLVTELRSKGLVTETEPVKV
jgi:chromosome segregation ATPase